MPCTTILRFGTNVRGLQKYCESYIEPATRCAFWFFFAEEGAIFTLPELKTKLPEILKKVNIN